MVHKKKALDMVVVAELGRLIDKQTNYVAKLDNERIKMERKVK